MQVKANVLKILHFGISVLFINYLHVIVAKFVIILNDQLPITISLFMPIVRKGNT